MPMKGKVFTTFAHVFKFNSNASSISFLYMYSTSASAASSNHFLVKYLIDSLGFSREEAITTTVKVISGKSFPKNPDLVVNVLKQTGLNQAQMKELIFKVPKLLYCNNITLTPKLHWLKEIGLSVSDLVSVISRDKRIIARSLDAHLRCRSDFLRSILGCDEDVLKIIKKSSWLLSYGNNKTAMANIIVMRNFGMSDEQIKRLLFMQPSYITQSSTKVLDVLQMVEKDFGVPHTSTTFVYATHVLCSFTKSKLESKFEIFRSFGWSDTDIFKMFGKMPYVFNLSGVKLEKGLSFFMNELGCDPAFLTSNPAFLAYSMDKRILPRFEVFKILEDHKQLGKRKMSLFTALYYSESRFIENFVLPYKDQIPSLYELLKKTVSQSSLPSLV